MALRPFRIFKDGIKIGQDNFNVSITNFADTFKIGSKFIGSAYFYRGWIDEFRFSIGTARWDDNFTVPVAEYTVDVYTKLLLHMNGLELGTIFTDEVGHIFTARGGAHTTTGIKQFGTASGKFNVADSGSDLIDTPTSADFNISGDSNFAVDFWAYMTALPIPGGVASFICSHSQTPHEDNRWGIYIAEWGGSYLLGIQYLLGGGLLFNFNVDVGPLSTSTWYHFAITAGDVIIPPVMENAWMRHSKFFDLGVFQGCCLGFPITPAGGCGI